MLTTIQQWLDSYLIVNPAIIPPLFKASYLLLLIPTAMVVISAFLSAKAMGGTLGQGLKKIAAGTIVDTILLMTYLLLESGYRGILDDKQIQAFFAICGLLASFFLIAGYIQLYRISKRLKLFTP